MIATDPNGFQDFDDIDWTDPEVRAQLWADSMVLREAIGCGLLDEATVTDIQRNL